METSLKTGFAQVFSCCPKNLSCPNFGGAAAPLTPPARTPMISAAAITRAEGKTLYSLCARAFFIWIHFPTVLCKTETQNIEWFQVGNANTRRVIFTFRSEFY